ncbi:MAG: hypothetical protein ACRDZ8_06335 [Acidimicrobiales bacterium]
MPANHRHRHRHPTATATATASRGDACDRLRRYRFRAHPPGSVTLPFQPGQHVWSAVSNGITLTLGMEPAAPHAGEPITFTMTATAPSTLPCWALYLEPSSTNGTAWQPIPTTGDACTGQALPTAAEHVLVQTYNRAGRLDFVFGANNLCVSSTSDVMAAMYSSFELGPGPSTAQGPLLPVLQVGDGRLPDQLHDPSLAAAYAHATDADGHLARFTVDWGDGTPVETYPGDQSPCIESSQGWPGSSTALMTSGLVYAAPTHRYSNPRPVAITVTVVSTGCDGTDPQQVTGTFPWVPPTP